MTLFLIRESLRSCGFKKTLMMRLVNPGFLALALFIGGCGRLEKKENPMTKKDPHSYAMPAEARVAHLHWQANVNFDSKRIDAVADWTIENEGADTIRFDTKDLNIRSVKLDRGVKATFRRGKKHPIFGEELAVSIKPETKRVTIEYTTSQHAEALQWLNAQQTAGKTSPFLFTQSQAILARSWIPCQDTPGVRFTYEADVTVPKELLALMSASNPKGKNETGTYHFEMKQPISSYLLALAAGDLTFKPISERAGVYAEKALVEKAAWEFADLEKMIAGAEELYGPYQWERYDVLVLPPSFPFGGMENPRLTFATPTILAGDRSLTSLIAHELAHSWSGNLVTNATWNDFWLNEGFTVYFETRIMEKLYGHDYAEMLASLNLQDLHDEIASLREKGQYADTRLLLDLDNRNPDEGVTSIAYNKGYYFCGLSKKNTAGKTSINSSKTISLTMLSDRWTLRHFRTILPIIIARGLTSSWKKAPSTNGFILKVFPTTFHSPTQSGFNKSIRSLHHGVQKNGSTRALPATGVHMNGFTS